MAGRKPKPTKLKVLQGTFRTDRANKNEPMPDPCIPEAPDHLSKEALIEWGRITNELKKLGLITNIDMVALAMYCQCWGRVIRYEKIVAEKGELYKTASGHIQISPAMCVLNKSMEQSHKFLTEFGLSPSSRTKVTAANQQKIDDPWAEYGS